MRPVNWRAMCILLFFLFVAMIAICGHYGGCETQIETAAGGSVPMKCHWTYIAIRWVCIGGLAVSVSGFFCDGKVSRRIVASLVMVMSVIPLILMTDYGIGLCADPEMLCHIAARGIWIASVLLVIVAYIMLMLSNPDRKKLPKKSL